MILLLSIVTIQSLITALLIYMNKKFKNEDFLLSLFFGLFFLHLSYKILLIYGFNDTTIFEKLHGGFSFLYAPINYFYAKSIFGKTTTKKQYFIHSTPFIVGIIFNFFLVYFLLDKRSNNEIIQWYNLITMLLFSSSFFTYSFFSLKFIARHKDVKDTIIQLKLKSVKVVSYVLIALSIMTITSLLLSIFDYKSSINLRYVYYLLLLIMFFSVIHIRFGIFFETQKNIEIQKEEKYKNYDLNSSEMDEIIEKINLYFSKRKMYLDSEFSLDILSLEIKIPKIKITQALNIRLNINFYQYLNTLRVEESKKLIDKTSDSNFSTIGYQSGFKNKSTFYKYFKQITGVTPSEYKKTKIAMLQ
jgi:AraC-like DNA-binding protein